MKKHPTIALFCILFVIVVGWLALFRFNSITSSFERDEGEYAYGGQILHDGGVLYKEDFMQKPPMIIYTYYVAEFFSPKTFAPRILMLLFLAFATLLGFDILDKEYSRRAAVIFLILFPALASVPFFDSLSAQPEIFLILPFIASLWCYFKYFREKNTWCLPAIGVFSALAFLYKPIVLPAVCFVMLCAVIGRKKDGKFFYKEQMKRFFFISAGFIMAMFIAIVPVLMRGGFLYMWDSAFKYNYYYSSVVGLDFPLLYAILFLLWPMLLLAVWCLCREIKHNYFFICVLFALFVGTAAGSFTHYYIIVLPVVSIIAAISLDGLADHVPSLSTIKKRNLFACSISLLLVFYLWFPYKDRFIMSADEITMDQFGTSPFRESVLMASELEKITSPNDTVFIYGNEPQILYYAHRKSATRFVITYPLTLNTPLRDAYVRELITQITNDHPKAIVTDGMPPFQAFLRGPRFLTPLAGDVTGLIMNDYTFVGAIITNYETGEFSFDSSFGDLKGRDVELALFVRKE